MIDSIDSHACGPNEREHYSGSQKLALGLIRLYQLTLSPWIGRQCRFYPTCSHYAAEAIQTYGVLKGSGLAAKRLAKCHPFHSGGVDLVPDPIGQRAPDIASDANAELPRQ